MKSSFNKKFALIVATILLSVIAVGTTLAYIYTNTAELKNTFNGSKVASAVVEGENDPVTDGTVNTGDVKEDVRIKNTGDTEAYIRVKIVATWKSANGEVFAKAPVEGTDYTITFAEGTNWIYGSDGYYYYKKPVPSSKQTSDANKTLTDILIEEAKLKDGVTPPKCSDNMQYYLSIEILASSIQSTPSTVVATQWGVTVANDGTISK